MRGRQRASLKAGAGLFLFLAVGLSAQTGPDPVRDSPLEERMVRIQQAVEAERYEQALEMIQEAQTAYPGAAGPFRLAGDLFSDKKLFEMAAENYERANQLKPDDYTIMTRLAEVYGKIDDKRKAVDVFEQLRELYPGDPAILSDLGWMYFKTYQVEKGILLLEEALEENPGSYGFHMTLGTLYSSIYEEEKAEKYYLKSIELGQKEGDRYFASVAHYNLGILYHNFYRYNDALEETAASLQMRDRSSGHILRGELFQSRMQFSRALKEFSQARKRDQTPLSLLNHAYLYSRFGMVEEALAYLQEALAREDLSWMYNYGIDQNHYRKDLHELQRDIYQGAARKLDLTPAGNPWAWLQALAGRMVYGVRGKYHDYQYRRYSWIVSEELLREKNFLDGWWIRYQALRGYGPPAEGYLEKAYAMEIEAAPACEPFYLLERGRETGRLELLLQAAQGLDPRWEAETLSLTLALILREHWGELPRQEGIRMARELYRMNPGGMRTEGIRLPVVLEWDGDWPGWARFRLRWGLAAAFRFLPVDSAGGGAAFRLRLARAGQQVRFTLLDPGGRALKTDSAGLKTWFGAAKQVINRIFSLE